MTDPIALAQLRHLYQNMVNGAVRDTASAKRIAEGLLAPAIEALERATPPAEQQAAPKAAPGAPFDECFPGESRVAVPQGLISAACFAIRNKRGGGKVLEQLRRYSVGDLSQPLAPQQKAQEPIADEVRELIAAMVSELRGIVGVVTAIQKTDGRVSIEFSPITPDSNATKLPSQRLRR